VGLIFLVMYINEVDWHGDQGQLHVQAWLRCCLHDAGQTSERNESIPQQSLFGFAHWSLIFVKQAA
jgi:hypothetical protein